MKPKVHLNACHAKKHAADIGFMAVNKKYYKSKTCISCKKNCNQTTDNELNSEIDMKNTLVKTRVDAKTACSYLNIMATCSMVEGSGMFKLFEKVIDKFKFPLESPCNFLPKNGALNNIKQCDQMKDVSSFIADQDVSFKDAMSFLEKLVTILKIPGESNSDTNQSHYKKYCLLLRRI